MTRTTADEQAAAPSDTDGPAGEGPAAEETSPHGDAPAEAHETPRAAESGEPVDADETAAPGDASPQARETEAVEPASAEARGTETTEPGDVYAEACRTETAAPGDAFAEAGTETVEVDALAGPAAPAERPGEGQAGEKDRKRSGPPREKDPEGSHQPQEGGRLRLPEIADPVRAAGVALVVAAAACAAYFGWSWYRAAHDESLSYSRARDAVLRAGEQGIENLNTLDYRKVGEGFARWEASSTGELHDQLVKGRGQFEAQVRQARTITTAKILEGAVTELDARAGKASVIVALQITVTPADGQPTTKPSRMRAQLTRTPSGWKLSALGQAPVGTTGTTG